MAIQADALNFRDGTILLEDGTGTPLDVTVQYEAGDLSISGLNQSLSGPYDLTAYMDRGELHTVRKTSRTFPSLSFSATYTDLSDASEETIPDIVLQNNAFSAAVSTMGANADVYTLKVTWTVTDPAGGTHILTADDVAFSIDIAEGDPNTFSLSGTVYGAITLA